MLEPKFVEPSKYDLAEHEHVDPTDLRSVIVRLDDITNRLELIAQLVCPIHQAETVARIHPEVAARDRVRKIASEPNGHR